jgi:hypothetical protein
MGKERAASMTDLDDKTLIQEMDRISQRIKDIMDSVDALYPPQQCGEATEEPSTAAPEGDPSQPDISNP